MQCLSFIYQSRIILYSTSEFKINLIRYRQFISRFQNKKTNSKIVDAEMLIHKFKNRNQESLFRCIKKERKTNKFPIVDFYAISSLFRVIVSFENLRIDEIKLFDCYSNEANSCKKIVSF